MCTCILLSKMVQKVKPKLLPMTTFLPENFLCQPAFPLAMYTYVECIVEGVCILCTIASVQFARSLQVCKMRAETALKQGHGTWHGIVSLRCIRGDHMVVSDYLLLT